MRSYPNGALLLEIEGRGPTYPQSKHHMRLLLRRFRFREMSPDVFRMRDESGAYRAQAYRYSLAQGWVSLHRPDGCIDLTAFQCPYG